MIGLRARFYSWSKVRVALRNSSLMREVVLPCYPASVVSLERYSLALWPVSSLNVLEK